MNQTGLQSFFDLGNSLSRHNPEAIGEKGHGTKVYLNSTAIHLVTIFDEKRYTAIMDSPKGIAGIRRILKIIQRVDDKGYTRYYLDDIRNERKLKYLY